MPRVPYVEKADLPAEYQYLFENNEVGELNIFKAVGNNAPVLQGYMRWGTVLWERSGLERRDVELVILAVAADLDAEYEWHQHAPIAADLGVALDDIRAIAESDFDALDEATAAMLRYAVSFVHGTVSDTDHEAVAAHFEPDTVVGIAMLASHYLATARTIDALGVEPETPFVGWDLSGLAATD
jgi:4-carboxymuconolactone decarboxylase